MRKYIIWENGETRKEWYERIVESFGDIKKVRALIVGGPQLSGKSDFIHYCMTNILEYEDSFSNNECWPLNCYNHIQCSKLAPSEKENYLDLRGIRGERGGGGSKTSFIELPIENGSDFSRYYNMTDIYFPSSFIEKIAIVRPLSSPQADFDDGPSSTIQPPASPTPSDHSSLSSLSSH